jgi:hypothetical protein
VEPSWATSRIELRSIARNCIIQTCEFVKIPGQANLPGISGSQGVAGSNPVVPTAQGAVLLRRGEPPFGVSTCVDDLAGRSWTSINVILARPSTVVGGRQLGANMERRVRRFDQNDEMRSGFLTPRGKWGRK